MGTKRTFLLIGLFFCLAGGVQAAPFETSSRYYPDYTHTTRNGTPYINTNGRTAIYIRQAGHVYMLVPMSGGRFWARQAWGKLETAIERDHAGAIIDVPADADPVTLTINGQTVSFNSFAELNGHKGQIQPVSGGGSSSSSSTSSSSSSSGADIDDQDDTPVSSSGGHNGSVPLCQLLGTCGSSSSTSSSSSSSSGSTTSSGGIIIPGTSSGGSIPDTSTPGTLPQAPSYSGNIYYVSPGGSGISTDQSKPGNAVTTLKGVDDGSTIKFLPGSYGSINIDRPKQTGRIKLVSSIPVLTAIDTTKKTSASYSTVASQIVKGFRIDGARFTRLELNKFSAPWVEGFYLPPGGGGINIFSSPDAWVVRNHVQNQANSATGILLYGKNENRSYVALENWVWNNRRDNNNDKPNWGMDYGIRAYGSKSGAIFMTKNLILGGYNQPISTKSGFKNTFIENNFLIAGDDKTTESPGVAKNLMVGQEADRPDEDRTGENVFIRGNTIRSDARGMIIFNAVNTYVEGNNFIDTLSSVSQFFSLAPGQRAMIGLQPRLSVIKGNWFNSARTATIDVWPRGCLPETLSVESNTVVGGKGRIALHTSITGDPDRPPCSNLTLPSVNRVGGDASGFSAPQTVQ